MKEQIAIYLRLSLEDVDKRSGRIKDVSNSIASQRLLINRFLDEAPALCDLPRLEFCDDGFSGTNFDRPDFMRMIDLARKGEIGCIVVKDLSRFGRDYLEVGDYLEHIFPFLGIRFISINDQYDSDRLKGKTIGMDVAFRNLVYDYYSKDLSKKVKSAMGVMQRNCELISCVPYGYKVSPDDRHKLVIDEEIAPTVRRIFLDIISGKSCTAIAKALNEEGVPTPAQQKNIRKSSSVTPQWTHTMIHNLIGNIKYTGAMVNHTRESRFIRDKNQRRLPREEWYIRENAHPAIVTREEYDAAMNAISRKRKSARSAHDQSDRVYYCGHCGGKLEKANGTVFACRYSRYHDGSPCEEVHWRKSDLEEVLFEALKRQIEITKVESRNIGKSSKEKSESLELSLSMLRSQLETIDRDKLTLYENYHESKITAEQYLTTKDDLTVKQSELKQQIADLEEQLKASFQEENIAENQRESASHLSTFTDEELREHLYDAVEKVLVYDGKSVEIVWRFGEAEDEEQLLRNA
ncbi:MAG: recombinase family protein [Oscillospiraceae bacterium]|nr:recombinase family protein [Oscillospiraceae bacterium]